MQVPLLLFLALAGAGDATSPEPQSSAEQTWSYEQSASVRLVIRSTPPLATPRPVTCSVVGPGPNGVTSTVRRVFRGGEYSAYYPNDFARRPAQGDYSWTCDVEDGVHAMGSFVIRDDGAVTLPARN